MAAARAAVKLGHLFLPGWREVEPTPDTGSQCTAHLHELEHPSVDTRQAYPVEVYVFRIGRVVGAAFFSFIADKASELRHARTLEGRLRGV